MRTAAIVVNLAIFLATCVVVVLAFHREGKWSFSNGVKAFRYFTMLSNVLCAISALVIAVSWLRGGPSAFAVTLKYMGVVAVTVTLLTVFLFLGPTQGFRTMLSGTNFYMHLVGPALAIASYLLWEKRPMTFAMALLGLAPVALYGILYLWKVVYAPEDQRWEDFYGFNRGGRWPVVFLLMLLGSLAVCFILWKV